MRLKPAQLAVLGVAVGAAGLAVMLMGDRTPPPQQQALPAQRETIPAVEVLVARDNIPVGKVITEQDLVWRKWPEGDVTAFVSRRDASAQSPQYQEVVGALARTPFTTGEPIQTTRLIRGTRGFMSAILTPGMRAVGTPIEDPSRGAGSFILPNDRVDVILVRRNQAQQNSAEALTHSSMTVLQNVRVLAVDTEVGEDNKGNKTVTARHATMELTAQQAEVLTLARELGTLSLSLRSLADGATTPLAGANEEDADDGNPLTSRGNRMTVVRFGVPQVTTVTSGAR